MRYCANLTDLGPQRAFQPRESTLHESISSCPSRKSCFRLNKERNECRSNNGPSSLVSEKKTLQCKKAGQRIRYQDLNNSVIDDIVRVLRQAGVGSSSPGPRLRTLGQSSCRTRLSRLVRVQNAETNIWRLLMRDNTLGLTSLDQQT